MYSSYDSILNRDSGTLLHDDNHRKNFVITNI